MINFEEMGTKKQMSKVNNVRFEEVFSTEIESSEFIIFNQKLYQNKLPKVYQNKLPLTLGYKKE